MCNAKTNLKMARFQVLTAANMKMTVLWDVKPFSLVEVYRRLRGAYCLQRPDRGSKHLRNIGKLVRDYTAQHPRRQSSSDKNVVPQG
jgi:hypothetical protein